MGELDFRRVFDQQNAFVSRNEFSEGGKQGRFAGARSTGDQQVAALKKVVLQAVCQSSVERPGANQILDFEMLGIELADRQRYAAQAAWRNNGGNATSIGEP